MMRRTTCEASGAHGQVADHIRELETAQFAHEAVYVTNPRESVVNTRRRPAGSLMEVGELVIEISQSMNIALHELCHVLGVTKTKKMNIVIIAPCRNQLRQIPTNDDFASRDSIVNNVRVTLFV